jgi:hypothetical protein
MRYRSFLESLSLSAALINLHLSAIRRLAEESAVSGWLSPELVTGIRRFSATSAFAVTSLREPPPREYKLS